MAIVYKVENITTLNKFVEEHPKTRGSGRTSLCLSGYYGGKFALYITIGLDKKFVSTYLEGISVSTPPEKFVKYTPVIDISKIYGL